MKPILMIASMIGGLAIAEVDAVSLELQNLRGAIAVFKIRTQRWPRQLADLVEAKLIDRVPQDPWGRPYLWIRPVEDANHGCLLSRGADGLAGTKDDVSAGCELELLNQHLLVEAGLSKRDRKDAYGNQIHIVRRRGGLIAWSFGPDGKPDTDDDQIARIAGRGR